MSSYITPSVLVYQQLANSGGAANISPDLPACIVGPAYNVVSYVSGSIAALIKTAALSSTTAVGTTTAGSKVITLTTSSPFAVGEVVLVPGASADGTTLQGTVQSLGANSITLDVDAGTSVEDVVITKQGKIVVSTTTNTFNFPSQKTGQVVNSNSVAVFVNAAKVETLSSKFEGVTASNELNVLAASTTGNTTASNATISSVASTANFLDGDPVVITGAGASGADLSAVITSIGSGTITVNPAPSTTVTGATITKSALSNVDPTTSTLKLEAGDSLSISYVNTSSATVTLETLVTEVTSVTGTITQIKTADMMPSDMSVATTVSGSVASGSSTIPVASATGIVAGDKVLIVGAGSGGSNLITTVGSVSGGSLQSCSPVTAANITTGAIVRKVNKISVRTRKTFNNQLLPITKPISSGANYAVTVGVNSTVDINPNPELVYGKVIKADVHIAYKALRTDLSADLLEIASIDDIEGTLGSISEDNPVALATQIAMANTTTGVSVMVIDSDDSTGYLDALDVLEGHKVYSLVPLTQDIDVLSAYKSHVIQMSTPEEKSWRIALVNTAIPTSVSVGTYSSSLVNANSGNNTITLSASAYVLTASNATFLSDGVTPGDIVNITAGTGSPSPVGTHEVISVISNQQLVLSASGTATGVSYYITRTLSKAQKAAAVAAASETFASNRVIHIQPDTVGVNVNGALKYLPGYYLCAAVAGMVAGFPAQQGFTNVSVAGIADLKYSNLYFTRAQMKSMGASGTFLFVQDTVGGLPYVRHELTTDMSVLEYRELMAVKDWDYVSYFFADILKGFIGSWNITPDTINTVRQTVTSGAELLKARKLPKIGPPLLSLNITSLEQNATSADNLDCKAQIKIPSVLNYLNLYLII